jgi:FkbM family methyltransferase
MAGPLTDGGGDPPLEALVEARTVAGMLLLPSADTIITPELVSRGVWEPRETRYLTTLLQAGQTFVDVGANVGYFSLFAAHLVGPGGTVIAVEPEPRNLDLLQRNIARNGVETVRVLPFAAAAAEGTMSLALDEENRGAHRLVASDDPQAGPCVRCVRLDDVLPERVDLIKIDAQGYDHEVIEGLERTLAANPKATLLVELSRFELARRGIDPETVFARYEELDFVLARFDASGAAQRVSAAEALAFTRDGESPDDFSLILERPAAPRFDGNARPRWVDSLEIIETEDGLEVLQPASGRWHELNLTAALVFELCSGERSVTAIAEVVQDAFELAEPPTAEVLSCLDLLRREGVVS